ncbi:hypothetical protein SAMN04515620_11866 [Collimonas sp. OK607]|nr:hypothetical protein SAMN04515620_11866 [Collimonas sp. OK607]
MSALSLASGALFSISTPVSAGIYHAENGDAGLGNLAQSGAGLLYSFIASTLMCKVTASLIKGT